MPKPARIIGAGTVCAAGPTLDICMESMFEGMGEPAPPTTFTCKQTVEYPVFEVPEDYITAADPALTRTVHLLLTALDDALDNEWFTDDAFEGLRVGVCIGTSVGASLNFLDFYRDWRKGEQPELNPIYRYLDSNPAEIVSQILGLDGPCQTVANACTSGADAIGIGAGWVRHGLCDVVIAGGADELSEISYNGFARLMITSPEHCRPFDANRRGLNLGEGAGLMILASDDVAKALSAPVAGTIAGYGTSGDAHHLTAPHPKARGLKEAINHALSQASLEFEHIDFINVHGTGTPANDPVEGSVLNELFPDTPFSATKGLTGHTLGAAGAIEACFSLACLEKEELPPSLGFEDTDPDIGTSPVFDRTPIKTTHAMSQSLAFGGNNSVLIISRGDA